MSGYTKLFSSILASTIWREDDKTRIVWITLLAMSDRHGIIEGSIPGLADFAHVSIAECEIALARLMAPDEYSRSPDADGRRIERVDGGWRLINHEKYRLKLDTEDRHDYKVLKQREYDRRSRLSRRVKKSPDVSRRIQKHPVLTHTSPSPSPSPSPEIQTSVEATQEPSPVLVFLKWFEVEYPKRLNGAKYRILWKKDAPLVKGMLAVHGPDRLRKLALVLLATDEEWVEGTDRGIGILSTKLNWLETRLAAWEARHGGSTKTSSGEARGQADTWAHRAGGS